MEKGYKRRNYFINKGFQGAFIVRLLAVSFAGSVFAVLLFIALADRKIDSLLYSMTIPYSVFKGNILLREALWANGIAVVVIAVIFVVAGIALFRKITGPLLNIKNGVAKISSGNLKTRIVLRKDDQFQDFACEVNQLSTELQNKFSAIAGRSKQISALAEELEKSGNGADRERIAALCNEIKELRQAIGEFRK
ncbi:MAG: methyl-accepting chemotaxis protein [Nitrospirae bacterium]|nr:methyl-accepting chemotaxis protein [Nitrospirota bacterium]